MNKLFSKKSFVAFMAAYALVVTSRQSEAAVSYSYSTDASTYDATSGPVSVKVYLTETLTSGSPSILTAVGGVNSAGFSVNRTAGVGANLTAGSFAPAFDAGAGINVVSVTNGSLSLTEAIGPGSPSATFDSTFTNRVFLGTLTIQKSGVGNTTSFSLGRFDDFGGNTISRGPQYYDLDFDQAASPAYSGATGLSSFSVVVPEPASLGLFTIVSAAGLLRRRK